MRKKYVIVLSVLMLALFAVPVLAIINNQPVSKPVVKPAKIFECESPPILDGSSSYDLDKDPLNFSWYLEENLFAQGKIVKVGSDIANQTGAYTFTLKVTDNGGSSDSRDVILTVVSNPIPHIDNLKYTIVSGNAIKERNFLIAGDIFQLEAVRGKSNHGETYVWKYDEKIFQKIGNGNVVRFKVVSASVQSNPKIKVSAFNACGKESNWMEESFVIRASSQNSLPTSSIEPPSKIYEGKRFQMFSSGSKTGQGFNEQGDKIVKWKWEITTLSGSVLLRSDAQNPTFTIENSGIFTAHLWVTDSYGAVGYSNETFPVFDAENDPSVADASATGKVAIHGKNFTLNGSNSRDPDGRAQDAIKRYEWYDMTYDSQNGDKLCSSALPTCVVIFNRTGEHNIRLKVFDAGVMSKGKNSDIKINVISPSQAPQANNGNVAKKEQQEVSLTSGKTQEAPIDPEKILGDTIQDTSTSAKPTPGMEAIIAIISILAIARRIRN